jgi:hypothetical protein
MAGAHVADRSLASCPIAELFFRINAKTGNQTKAFNLQLKRMGCPFLLIYREVPS